MWLDRETGHSAERPSTPRRLTRPTKTATTNRQNPWETVEGGQDGQPHYSPGVPPQVRHLIGGRTGAHPPPPNTWPTCKLHFFCHARPYVRRYLGLNSSFAT